MTQSSLNPTNTTYASLFHENEIRTNRRCGAALGLMGLLYILLGIYGLINRNYLPTTALVCTMLGTGAAACLVWGIGRRVRHDAIWLRQLIISAFLLSSALILFINPLAANFLVFGPIIISAMYYNRRVIHLTTLHAWTLFTLAVWGNVLGEICSEPLRQWHSWQGISLWQDPLSVISDLYFPQSIVIFIIGIICRSIAVRGRELVETQSRISAQSAAMESELTAAAELQKSSLPAGEWRRSERGVTVRAFMQPAKSVGGDFYDYFLSGEQIVVLVGDVSDKGLPAALFMMRARDTIRLALRGCHTLQDAVSLVNETLCRDNPQNMFVSLWIASIHMGTGVGKYVSCGHVPPLVRRGDGSVRRLENDPDPLLGLFEQSRFRAHTLRLERDDTLLVFTDGLTDAENRENEFFGEKRLAAAVSAWQETDGALCPALRETLSRFTDGAEPYDDRTLLTLRLTPDLRPETQTLRVSAKPDSIELLLDTMDAMLRRHRCPENIRRELDVALDEICGNVVDYAYPAGEGDMTVTLDIEANCARITVTDHGIPFHPNESRDEPPTGEPTIGGLGIYLVRQTMDRVDYDREGDENHLTMYKVWSMP